MRIQTMQLFSVILLGIGVVPPLTAQPSAIPSHVAAKVRALGPVFNDEVRSSALALYGPLHQEPGSDILAKTDVSYGPDERHKLDVIAPASKPASAVPVIIYIHGGAYVRGNKSIPSTPFFKNIAAFWARNNMVGVNINFRLAPKHQWPSAAQDIAAAIQWIRHNIETFGGDRNRLILMGHSSGASHIAGYLFYKQPWLSGGDGVVGAILMSGGYDLSNEQTAGRRAYYGEDQSTYAERSPLRHIRARDTPIFIVFAEYDPPRFQLEAIGLFKALCERENRCPPMKQLRGHNHLTQLYHIGTSDDSVGSDLVGFVRSLK